MLGVDIEMWELILGAERATLTGVMSELPSVCSDTCRNPAMLGMRQMAGAQIWYSRAMFASRMASINSKRTSPSLKSPPISSVIFSSR